ncbi:MAG: DNA polymerase III subunit delta [Anaerolineales bacterium]|nr:DNA polymerase III subunit delta [Anaerolineales bacterium]MCB9129276.1 DNA polymerase III subunit delta [Ardenticatenales bacterium]
MIYLFFGEDELSRDEAVAALLSGIDDPMGDLNQNRLDAASLSFGELRHACDSPPFLSDRRIVVVTGLLQRLAKGNKDFAEQFVNYIPTMPPYSRLFLLEGSVDKRMTLWKRLDELSGQKPPTVFVREYGVPQGRDRAKWVQQRAQRYGGQIGSAAATLLADVVGDDLRLIDQEVRKLVTYAGDQPVSTDDVQAIVPYMQEMTIWELVDAVGMRKVSVALAAAERILSEDPSKGIYLHIMITRQIRLLLQVAELKALGQSQQQIRSALKLHSFVAGKLFNQANNFTVERLVAAYDRLLDSDIALKSGADHALTLNLLIVDLAGRRAA